MSVYTNDVDTLRQFISQSIPQLINSLATLISTLVSMIILNIPLTILSIAITAKGDERDELNGFDIGADEYISKPFSPKILVARVNALLRRANKLGKEAVISEAGGIVMDKTAHTVAIDGRDIELSVKEFELLDYFMSNQGIALTRERTESFSSTVPP